MFDFKREASAAGAPHNTRARKAAHARKLACDAKKGDVVCLVAPPTSTDAFWLGEVTQEACRVSRIDEDCSNGFVGVDGQKFKPADEVICVKMLERRAGDSRAFYFPVPHAHEVYVKVYAVRAGQVQLRSHRDGARALRQRRV